MIDLVALPGSQHIGRLRAENPPLPLSVVVTDQSATEVSEQIRRLVAAGWVRELLVRGDKDLSLLNKVVEAGRLSGRRFRVVSGLPLTSLPPAQGGEVWREESHEGSHSWVLLPPQRALWALAAKRLVDILGALVLLIALLPVFLAIALAVKVSSEGPVFYAWRVLGHNGRPFVGFKFRTMVRGADSLKSQLSHLNERKGPVFKMSRDPRVTYIGRWLRKHSLDELPQLWSVLVGDMSLVGPRPAFASEYANYELWQMRRLSVTPGLSCLWQLDGRRTMNDFSEWARLDLQYIDSWSLRNDFLILWRTPLAVIKGTGH